MTRSDVRYLRDDYREANYPCNVTRVFWVAA